MSLVLGILGICESMRIPSSRFHFLNHLLNRTNKNVWCWDCPGKLTEGLIAIGWCPGIYLGYKPSNQYFGMMLIEELDDNNEFWTHVTSGMIKNVFGEIEWNKALEIQKRNE